MAYVGQKPADKVLTSADITDGAVGTADIADDAVTNAKIANQSITINGSAINLGGSVTVGETKPTITGISPSVITNDATSITITGTNFVSVPTVEAINSTGAITRANSVSFTSATSISANFTLPTDGTYFLRVENNDGLAVRSSSALLTVSDLPAWTTSAGSLGSFGATESIGTITLTATDSVSMAKVSGTFPGGVSLNSGSGSSTLTGTESGSTSDTTYSFTITITHAANNSGNFN